MKRFTLLSLLWFVFIPSAIAQKVGPLPDAEVLKAANDSILTDAYALYLHERIAWVMEDVLADSRPTTINEIAGWFPVGDTENKDVVKGVFSTKKRPSRCLRHR